MISKMLAGLLAAVGCFMLLLALSSSATIGFASKVLMFREVILIAGIACGGCVMLEGACEKRKNKHCGTGFFQRIIAVTRGAHVYWVPSLKRVTLAESLAQCRAKFAGHTIEDHGKFAHWMYLLFGRYV